MLWDVGNGCFCIILIDGDHDLRLRDKNAHNHISDHISDFGIIFIDANMFISY